MCLALVCVVVRCGLAFCFALFCVSLSCWGLLRLCRCCCDLTLLCYVVWFSVDVFVCCFVLF